MSKTLDFTGNVIFELGSHCGTWNNLFTPQNKQEKNIQRVVYSLCILLIVYIKVLENYSDIIGSLQDTQYDIYVIEVIRC